MSRNRSAVHLSEVLKSTLDRVRPETALARLQQVWPTAVGPQLAEWATPTAERGGVVTVECADSLVAHELEMLKPELLERLGDLAPQELKFRVR